MSLPSVLNTLEMLAWYLMQTTFFYEAIFQIGEPRLKKIRQLGQNYDAETGKQNNTMLLAYYLNK